MPRISKVGDGHASPDYLTMDLWWATEFQVDYGAPIKALCKGNIGLVDLSGNTPNGYEIDSIDSIYDGKNHNNLPVFSGLKTLSPNGVISNFLLTDPVGYQNAFLESGADNVLIKNFYLKPSASPASHMYAMYFYSESVNRVVRNCVIDARNIGQSTLIRVGYNRPFNVSNYIIFGGGVNCAGSEGIQNYSNGLSYNSTTSDYDAATEKTNAASEDNTGSIGWTGYNGGELVDPENEDFRTKNSSPLADDGNGGFIGAFLESGGTVGTIITPTGISSTTQAGSPAVINLTQFLGATGVTSVEAFGSPVLLSSQILQPTSTASIESIGSPSILSGAITLGVEGVSSQDALGAPKLIYTQLVSVTGVSSQEMFGIAIVQDGVELIIPLNKRDTYQKIQEYLASTGRFVSESNNGIILEWLRSEGIDEGQINDALFQYLKSKGFTGAYNDKWKGWRNE
tara:strand:- start:21232 stop:22596 length:1365 start_codon:yes stop_codon:yes gene_type:complete